MNDLCLSCRKHFSKICKEIYVKHNQCDYFDSTTRELPSAIEAESNIKKYYFTTNCYCPNCGSNKVNSSYNDRIQCSNCGKIYSR